MQQKAKSFPEPALADVYSGSQPSQSDAVATADQLHNGVCLRFPREGGIAKGTTFTGRLTTYGGDCKGCGGSSSSGLKLSAKTGVNNTNSPYLTYKGKKYYCLAADRSIPFGTVIKISNHNLKTSSTIYGIVVDRGGAIKRNKIDIFNGSEYKKKYFTGGTSYNTKFEIVSLGNGRAYFWR